MARAAIGAAMQVFQCSRIWPRSVVWSICQHHVLAAVTASALLLPEQKPPEIPSSARVHRCLQMVAAVIGECRIAASRSGISCQQRCIGNLVRLDAVEWSAVRVDNLDRIFVQAPDYLCAADNYGQLIRAEQNYWLADFKLESVLMISEAVRSSADQPARQGSSVGFEQFRTHVNGHLQAPRCQFALN
ncbi:hypothetical protein SS05631_c14370 [Sinorhizobium sp. CCBAU 05631]|nr:hypothetical protein SS05631_c14370 [Sinorhizobium sp. CCBAU 05631]